MKIYIESQILEYENKTEQINSVLKEIDRIVAKGSKVLSHMLIDDIEIYHNHYDYLLDNIKVIERVEVILHTYQELVNEILISTWEYIERIPARIEHLANEFYKTPDRQSWEDLNDFLGGIGWIISTLTTIDEDMRLKDVVSSYEDWNTYVKKVLYLNEILPEFEEILSSEDYVSIADILLYEILPTLKDMMEDLSGLVSVGGSPDDLN